MEYNTLIRDLNEGACVCDNTYKHIKDLIHCGENNISILQSLGDEFCKMELKKYERSGIAHPLKISINNYLGYLPENHFIKENDVICIEMSVHINGNISYFAQSFSNNNSNSYITKGLKLLDKLSKNLVSFINEYDEEEELVTDDIKIYLENKILDKSYTLVENSICHQQFKDYLFNEDSKYIVFNPKKYYDTNDYLISPENINWEIDDGDVFTINLNIIPSDFISDKMKIIKYDSDLYYFTNMNKSVLKLDSSKNYYNTYFKSYKHFPFYIKHTQISARDKMGSNECINKFLLDKIDNIKVENVPFILTKKFTILLTKKDSKVKCYSF